MRLKWWNSKLNVIRQERTKLKDELGLLNINVRRIKGTSHRIFGKWKLKSLLPLYLLPESPLVHKFYSTVSGFNHVDNFHSANVFIVRLSNLLKSFTVVIYSETSLLLLLLLSCFHFLPCFIGKKFSDFFNFYVLLSPKLQ